MKTKDIIEVEDYIQKNMDGWIDLGHIPCLKTIIKIQNSVFLDIGSYDIERVLKNYCFNNNISFKKKQKTVDRKYLTCYFFTRNK